MSSKLRIRIGEVEIDYEGTEEFLKQELPSLLKTAMELHKAAGGSAASKTSGTGGKKEQAAVGSLTTGTVAARLKAKSGADLLIAAAAHLALVARKETFSRQQLLTEMQDATAYYKKSYSNNLSKSLSGAVTDGKLQETAKNTYALSAGTRGELEAQLANS